MRYIFFLIPLLIGVPLAYADIEKGINFDRELIEITPEGTEVYKWTSTAERILEDGIFENYLWSETDDYLRFESERITFEFYKDTCDFKLYEPGRIIGEPVIESYSTTVSVQGIPINAVCLVRDIVLDNDGVDFTVKRGAATIFYELDYSSGVEWTYDVVGNGVITITEVCTNCIGEQIDDQTISLGVYTLDTKNHIHGAFKESSQSANNYLIKYEAVSNGRLIIDPELNTGGTSYRSQMAAQVSSACSSTGLALTQVGLQVNLQLAAANESCYATASEVDISSIPDSATITDVDFSWTPGSVTNGRNCDYNHIATQPSSYADTAGNAALMFTDILDGTEYIDDDAGCTATSLVSLDLGTTADSDMQTALAVDWFAVGLSFDNMVRDASIHDTSVVGDGGTFVITYITIPTPDSVDDLTSTEITYNSVDLDWTEPNLNTGNLTGYQVNYTTPWSDNPNTVITNNTESSDSDAEVTGLSDLTQYSFRIGVWTESFNGTGNVLNITTLEDFVSANFTPGFFDLNATNPDVIQMYFERTDTNSTSLVLKVIYPTAYDLSCDFSYEFANINQTYSGLSRSGTTHSGIDSAVESEFQFNDVDNEIIDVYCWDENNLINDGSYIITQSMFPLLQQIADFRAGEFGTAGQFGAMDLITMFVIVISMIGFNRVNESVGAIFNIIMLGSLAYFEVIELPTIIFGMIAVVIMVVIGTTRKK